jgi:2,3-bisphosphoglycerate-dependent phosphoglycerate mutase
LGTHGNLLALIVHAYLPAHGYAFWRSLTMPDVVRLQLASTGGHARAPVLERLWAAHGSERR